jgi:uridine kinase
MAKHIKLVAITGGSGAGKTWLADWLQHALAPDVACLSLDDFYHDRSSLPPEARARFNFDHPEAIDWPLFQAVLDHCRQGNGVQIPSYDFTTHSRQPVGRIFVPASLVLVEGLWLLWQRKFCDWFDMTVFLDCPADLRLERRLVRDVAERGRSADSVRAQFWDTVAPMHDAFVAPQSAWADLVLQAPVNGPQLVELAEAIQLGRTHSAGPQMACYASPE